MTDPPHSTMAASEAAAPSRANSTARTASSDPPATQVTKNFVTRDFDLALRAFFPTPTAPAKFNPISAMRNLFRILLKDEHSLVLRTSSNDDQIVLNSASLPIGETAFKKFFKVSTSRVATQKQTHVCIGCHVLSNRTLGNIKFKSPEGNLLAWLKKEKIFLEADSLGIDRPVTIGYFTKIDPSLTHLSNFRNHLLNQLLMVEIEATTAVVLAPHLKQEQLDAMSNGDEFVPDVPDFEVYRTRLSHGRDDSRVSTEVLGVKCAPRNVKLLGEFFTRMATATNNDHHDGVFLPKGAAYLLGPQTYGQIMRDNNFFLTTVATVPVNLEYEAWFAIIDPHQTSDTDPVSLYDHLLKQPWFLRIESVAKNKCLVVTTKSNLQAARDWIDANLEPMIRKSIPSDIAPPPSSLLPRRLDKPVFSATSVTYADILKKQFSLSPTKTTNSTTNNRPPRKRQATRLDYDSDQSQDPPQSTAKTGNATGQAPPTPATPLPVTSDKELMSIKTEINSLRILITTAMEQFTAAIATKAPQTHTSASPPVLEPCAMETDVAHPQVTTSDLLELIAELKHDIATIAVEMRAKFSQQNLLSQQSSQSTVVT